MEKSTVYFTDFRCPVGTSQLVKLKKYRLGLAPGPQADGVDALIQEMEDGLWP